MELIDKSALVAEIENRIDRCNTKKWSCPANTQVEAICDNKICAYKEILSFLNTLEVKEENRRRELSYEDYVGFFGEHPDFPDDWGFDEAWVFAKHFFELGLKKLRKMQRGNSNR